MFLSINNVVCYINEKEVISVSIKPYMDKFIIEILYKLEMSTIDVDTEQIAKRAVEDIIDNIKKVEKTEEKTYLDGFRDGTEYALKLIERKL